MNSRDDTAAMSPVELGAAKRRYGWIVASLVPRARFLPLSPTLDATAGAAPATSDRGILSAVMLACFSASKEIAEGKLVMWT
jgi:hypothetical protein